MSSEPKFGMLRNLLRAIGLSKSASDDVVDFIVDLLAGERKDSPDAAAPTPEYPYHLREQLLSPAELSFYEVLRTIIGDSGVIFVKVGLGDIFKVKKDDPSRYRIYTNKIDRKHVDFLICDPATMRPLLGVELDDKSHQRPDRQERDAFVDEVFKSAGLGIVHVPAKRGYVIEELAKQIAPYITMSNTAVQRVTSAAPITPKSAPAAKPQPVTAPTAEAQAPACPKCGGEMVLRKAKSGANAGNRFWGCTNYPACRSMLPYAE